MLALSLILALSVAVEDPRIALVRLQLEGRPQEALVLAEQLIAANPALANELGIPYLKADLLDRTTNSDTVAEAFLDAFATRSLEPWSRLRVARKNEEQRHPEVAAGVVSTMLGKGPPKSLLPQSVALLRRCLAKGGDCRVIGDLDTGGFPPPERRMVALSRAICSLRQGDRALAAGMLIRLLEENLQDEAAREAVDWLAPLLPLPDAPQASLLIGLTLYHHREFERSIRYLDAALRATPGAPLSAARVYDTRYALARSRFWLDQHQAAAAAFELLARDTTHASGKAQALYQAGRSHELLGDWQRAADNFRRSYNTDSLGEWADASLFSALRLEWRTGNESAALPLYTLLRGRREWQSMAVRAALFMASSDLVRTRTDRAASWLVHAEAGGRAVAPEVAYWRGRLDEAAGRQEAAIEHFARAARLDPHHPLGQAALERLSRPPLAAGAVRFALARASGERVDDLYVAWLILGKSRPEGLAARRALEAMLRRDRLAAPFLDMQELPVEAWPLWHSAARQPEELLVGLGIFDEGAAAVPRLFPGTQPALAMTGSLLLARAGAATQSLRMAESLAQRIPDRVPLEILPEAYQRLLYPAAHAELIARQSLRFGVDPALLAAIIREESRFDASALSGASARGLTQFVMPTANRLAASLQMPKPRPADLYDPALAITLGAAYLDQLGRDFGGATHQVVAAYNAGEPQAGLWKRYCFTEEPEEYFSKVGFLQTRDYLRKVLTSYSRYRQIYPQPVARAAEAKPLAGYGLRPASGGKPPVRGSR